MGPGLFAAWVEDGPDGEKSIKEASCCIQHIKPTRVVDWNSNMRFPDISVPFLTNCTLAQSVDQGTYSFFDAAYDFRKRAGNRILEVVLSTLHLLPQVVRCLLLVCSHGEQLLLSITTRAPNYWTVLGVPNYLCRMQSAIIQDERNMKLDTKKNTKVMANRAMPATVSRARNSRIPEP